MRALVEIDQGPNRSTEGLAPLPLATTESAVVEIRPLGERNGPALEAWKEVKTVRRYVSEDWRPSLTTAA